jgi:hypothetical protein
VGTEYLVRSDANTNVAASAAILIYAMASTQEDIESEAIPGGFCCRVGIL